MKDKLDIMLGTESFVDALEKEFGKFPIILTKNHIARLVILESGCSAAQRISDLVNPFAEIVEAIKTHGEVELGRKG